MGRRVSLRPPESGVPLVGGLAEIEQLRNLDGYPCDGAYLFSESIPMPAIESNDSLFE